ncbi:MAG: TraI domain-containing protein [Legionellales bacterium]|nr:TraI domain-containing protein [Legionellales bacterium]
MFYREEKKAPAVKKPAALKNLDPIESFEILLKDKKRQEALSQIKQNLAYQASHYQKLAAPLIAGIAMYYQMLPETSLYFSHRGGLLDRALYRTEAALSLMQQLMIRDESGLPSEDQKLWLYALFSASLLQGIGKLYTEYQITIHNSIGTLVKGWEPLLEDMRSVGDYYRYQFIREDSDSETLRKHVSVLLAQQLMPKEGFALLSSNPAIFKAWLALLEEDRDGAGSLSAILDRANAITDQKYLNDYLDEHGHLLENGTGRVGTFLDNVPEHTVERERAIGAEFLIWLHDALASGRLVLNQEPIRAEIYPAGAVLSAEVYDMFLQEHLKLKSKYIVQRALGAWQQQLLLDHANTDAEKKISKIYLRNANLPETVKIYNPKTEKNDTVRTLDLVHDMEAYTRDYAREPILVHQLDLKGKWTTKEVAPVKQFQDTPSFKPRG